MPSPHYIPTGKPRGNIFGSSQNMRDEFELIEAGIGELSRYALHFYVADANNAPIRYVPVPFDLELTRVGILNYKAQEAAKNLTCDFRDYPTLDFVELETSNFLQIQGGATAGEVLNGVNVKGVIANGAFSKGDVIRNVCNSSSALDQQVMIWMEFVRTN